MKIEGQEPVQMSGWEIRRSEVVASRAMVTAKHPAVAKIGVEVLKKGGNAIDAAVAMAFGIDVAEPRMTGIGGGGFMTVALANGESYVVDFFPRAPGGATDTFYELTPDFKADKLGFSGVKDNANALGRRSVGIPGAVAGPLTALERWGTLSRAEVLDPAIRLAREGFALTFHDTLMSAIGVSILRHNPEADRLYLDNGGPVLPGTDSPVYFKQPELAESLEQIKQGGVKAFYEGELAQKIVEELQKGGHPVSLEDFSSYQALIKEPLLTSYRGLEFVLLPGAAGGPTIAEIIHILEGWNLGSLGHNTTRYLHILIEACKLALADRLAYLCEETPGGPPVPWRELASPEFAAERRKLIGDKALGTYPSLNPFDFAASVSSGYKPSAETCTTFLSAWDEAGNAVALTQTLNGSYGSGVAVPGTGILLNNAMVLFDPRPGQPNSVGPNKRPLSSMSHFIARYPKGPLFALAGAPGGRKIVDTVAQVLLNMVDFGMGPQAACGSPFIDPAGEGVLIDQAVGETVLSELAALGHQLNIQEGTIYPRLSANPAAIKRDGAILRGGVDLFTAGVAAGF